MKMRDTLYELIRARKERGLTQADIAKIVGKSRREISFIECGKRTLNFDKVASYVGALNSIKPIDANSMNRLISAIANDATDILHTTIETPIDLHTVEHKNQYCGESVRILNRVQRLDVASQDIILELLENDDVVEIARCIAPASGERRKAILMLLSPAKDVPQEKISPSFGS